MTPYYRIISSCGPTMNSKEMFENLVSYATNEGAKIYIGSQIEPMHYNFLLFVSNLPYVREYKINPATCEWVSNNKSIIRILIQREWNAEDVVILSHELGHHLDWKSGSPYLSGMIGTQEERYQQEVRAWNLSAEILKRINFHNWDIFIRVRDFCLKSYGKNNVE